MKKVLLSAALVCSVSFASLAGEAPIVTTKISSTKVVQPTANNVNKKKVHEFTCDLWETPCGAIGTACGDSDEEYWSCVFELFQVMCP